MLAAAVAGHETTVNLIGNGMLALLRHPDQLARLRTEPTLIGSAVEELLRFDAPVQMTGRIATQPIEIDGHAIEPGQWVLPLLGAANHDPAQFADPETLDLSRNPNNHVAFGRGIHFCLGAPLARLEGQIAIGRVGTSLSEPSARRRARAPEPDHLARPELAAGDRRALRLATRTLPSNTFKCGPVRPRRSAYA